MSFTDFFLRITYNPSWNVYLVWIIGIYCTWYYFDKTSIDPNELSESEREKWDFMITKDGEWRYLTIRLFALMILPGLGMLNDIIFLRLAGEGSIFVYNQLWLGLFFSLSKIEEMLSRYITLGNLESLLV